MINSKVTNFNNIRKKNIPYIVSWVFFYAWLLSFFTWWVNNFKTSTLFDEKILYSIYFLLLLFIGVMIFIVKPSRFKYYFKYGCFGTIVSLLIYQILINIGFVDLSKYITFILSFSMGISYIGLLQTYIYVLNNTEKFYSIIFGNFMLMFITLIENFNVLNITGNYIFLIIILIFSLIPTIKFNTHDYYAEKEEHANHAPKISKTIYFSLLINCFFMIFCRGVGRAFLLLANDMYSFDLEIYYYGGGVIGIILVILIYTFIKRCNSITWNIVFSSFVLAAFLYMWPDSLIIKKMYALFLGTGIMMGIISMYYILGIISKKYWNFSYVKYNILIVDVLGCCLGTTLGNYIYKFGTIEINNIILTISVFMTLILLVISPILVTTFFNGKWNKDSRKAKIDNLNIRRYLLYDLTPKEIVVCNYLIDNLTTRQIAANMNISENTVKFHKKQIFKKLDINSKEEILKKIKE